MEIKITCPECHKTFSINEKKLFEHNSNEYNKFINDKVKMKLSEAISDKENQLNKEKALEVENLKIRFAKEKSDFEKQFQIEKSKELQEKLDVISSLKNKISSIEENKKLEIDNYKVKLEAENIKFKNELISKQQKELQEKLDVISSLKNKISSIEENKKLEIDNYKVKLEAENIKFKNELISKQQKELQEKLDVISSLKNKISSIEENKKLEIDNYKVKLEAEKQSFDKEVKIKLLEAEEKIKKPFLEQIEILKIANEKHKVINSKVKGENFEHDVESELKKVFGFVDKIEKINDSSQEKADFLQTVIVNKNKIGKIVYEVKNAKWSDSWIEKLVKDCARKDCKYGILVATSFKEKYGSIPFIKSVEYENIWITDDEGFIFVAQILRKLVEVDSKFEVYSKAINAGSDQEQLNKLLKIKEALDEYLKNDLKVLITDFNKEFKKLLKVNNSLLKNANDIKVVEEKLKRKVNNELIKKLEKISGETFIQDEETFEIEN